MAVYGYDYFGLSKYGSAILTDFGIDPFTAEAISHSKIRVEWNQPSGNWTAFRLLKSRNGFSINENDGILLYSRDTKGPTGRAYVDQEAGAGWNYYTVYLYDATNIEWIKAAQTSALGITDYNFTKILWDSLPNYYKVLRDTSAGYSPTSYRINPAIYLTDAGSVDNQHLKKFLSVIGWGTDLLRSQAETIRDGYDPSKVHLSRLVLLAGQFGFKIEQSAPTSTTRNLVRNLGLLYRSRGTPSGLKELLSLSTGWDVDVVLGPNIMLNRDQSAFESPIVEEYDKGTTYQVGELVQQGGLYYEAKLVTFNNAPSNTTYWNQIVAVKEDTSTKRSSTQNHSTWQAVAQSPKAPLVVDTATHIGRGVTRFDTNTQNQNALGLKNTAATTKDIILQSAPYNASDLTAYDRKLVLESVIPVPAAVQIYDGTKRYAKGELVRYQGVVYESVISNSMVPTNLSYWKKLGYDARTRLAFSLYAHGPFAGVAGTGNRTVTPWIAGFDDQGNTIWELELNSALLANVKFDTFNTVGALAIGKSMDLGGSTWTGGSGTWAQGFSDTFGGYQYPNGTTKVVSFFTFGFSDGVFGITLPSVGTRKLGLLLRHVTATTTSYIRVDQSQIVQNAAGVETVLSTHSTPFTGGERMLVTLSGPTITVKRNGVQVSSGSSTQNQTTTTHGVVIEA